MKDKVVRQLGYTSHYPCLSRGHRKYINVDADIVVVIVIIMYTQHIESQRHGANLQFNSTYIHT